MIAEVLQYPFMVRALLASVFIALVCAYLGIFVVLRGMAFLSDAIAHFSLTGVAIGFLVGVSPRLSAMVFCVLFGFLILSLRSRLRLQFDTSIGVLFSGSLAFGVILVTRMNQTGLRVSLHDLLFGEILGVAWEDVYVVGGLATAVLVVALMLSPSMVQVAFNEDLAKARGISTRRLELVFMTLMAVTIAVSIQLVGAVLVGAMMIVPAATAKVVARSFRLMVVISLMSGACAGVTGIFASYHLDTPPGPTLVMAALVIFGFVVVVGRMATAVVRREPSR